MNTAGLELFDICAAKHRGSAESEAAFRGINAGGRRRRQRSDVLQAIILSGSNGISCRELACWWGVGMNTISGRFTELKAAGKIHKAGRRDGCGVYVAGA